MADLFSESTDDIPIADMIACVSREIAMRRRVYPRWVAAGKMTEAAAQVEIARMEAVLGVLKKERADG
jgi:hypothetical protein